MPSNRALEADARRSHLRPTSEASGGLRRPRSLSGPLLSLSHRASPPPNFSLSVLRLDGHFFSFSLSLPLSFSPCLLLSSPPPPPLCSARAFTCTKRDVCMPRREDNGALDHALVLLSREFDVTACCNA